MLLFIMISCTSSGLMPGKARGMIFAGVRMLVMEEFYHAVSIGLSPIWPILFDVLSDPL